MLLLVSWCSVGWSVGHNFLKEMQLHFNAPIGAFVFYYIFTNRNYYDKYSVWQKSQTKLGKHTKSKARVKKALTKTF